MSSCDLNLGTCKTDLGRCNVVIKQLEADLKKWLDVKDAIKAKQAELREIESKISTKVPDKVGRFEVKDLSDAYFSSDESGDESENEFEPEGRNSMEVPEWLYEKPTGYRMPKKQRKVRRRKRG